MARLDYSVSVTPVQSTSFEGQTIEAVEATRVTKVDELEESLKDYKIRLDSMHSKNESLQNKLDLINMDNVQLAVPQGLITKAVNDSIAKVHNKYIETIKEGQSLLDELELDVFALKKNHKELDKIAHEPREFIVCNDCKKPVKEKKKK